jgi:glycosyltransferase involved in cell wall biosynthesis
VIYGLLLAKAYKKIRRNEYMKRLLCIIGSMNVGGAETFLMKIYRKIDRTKYQMDFAVATPNKNFYEDEIRSLGGRIFCIPSKSEGFIRNFLSIYDLVFREKYKYVLRISQHALSAIEILAAWIGGAKVRVFRSSNTNTTTGSYKESILHHLFLFMPKYFANVRFAPSTEAAEYMFGKGCIKMGKAFLIRNGIDLDEYQYNEKERDACRKEFGIEKNFVIGHIGRFNQQKNHKYLIEVFKCIKEKRNDAVLLLVGTGELEDKIRRQVIKSGLIDCVIFTNIRSDVPKLLNAMDVFILPSLYEGMPNVVIEAQATGLPCIISDTITQEVKITPLIKFLSLNKTAQEWSNSVIEMCCIARIDMTAILAEKEYDINIVTTEFIKSIFSK